MTTIKITDCGTIAEYTLAGDVLTMTKTGGCSDALNDNLCAVDESMPDERIAADVRAAWIADYEGDPDANGLAVRVSR